MSLPTNKHHLFARRVRELPCIAWRGRPTEYQAHAKMVLEDHSAVGLPWIHVVPECGTKLCIQELHLRVYRAKRIAYPEYVCVYCGLSGYTKDHLLPVTVTGEAVRRFVAVVPACQQCNSAIGDRCSYRISERREEAHRHIEQRYRKLLIAKKQWTPDELRQLGPNLRSKVENSLARAEVVEARLAWPDDPEYDRRAMEKSGFDELTAMELM